jgi:hypothetical protein
MVVLRFLLPNRSERAFLDWRVYAWIDRAKQIPPRTNMLWNFFWQRIHPGFFFSANGVRSILLFFFFFWYSTYDLLCYPGAAPVGGRGLEGGRPTRLG